MDRMAHMEHEKDRRQAVRSGALVLCADAKDGKYVCEDVLHSFRNAGAG